MRNDITDYIKHICAGETLSHHDAERAFDLLMGGQATPAQMGGFLMALRMRGETVEEIIGGVTSMRTHMSRVEAPEGSVDIVGTGGDAKGSYNISTASALVTAACGIPVAKHGNRAMSSKSGSSDVLTALGVNIHVQAERISQLIRDTKIGFMFAPVHHMAMRHVMPVRVELGVRTIFNMLGPLSNPAGVEYQVTGVFDPRWLKPLAEALGRLGSKKAWITYGSDGLDEITVSGITQIAEMHNGIVKTFQVSPEDVGLKIWPFESLLGADAQENADALKQVLSGTKNAYRDAVLMNAGAAVYITGNASTYREGVERAARAIDEGNARRTLENLVVQSNKE